MCVFREGTASTRGDRRLFHPQERRTPTDARSHREPGGRQVTIFRLPWERTSPCLWELLRLRLQRPGCVEKARRTLREPTDVTLEEYIPDRFLCSGGSSGYQDAISCKGAHCVYSITAATLTDTGSTAVALHLFLCAQATRVDPCFCKREIATFRSARFFTH